uniref:Uncharacterized protein n=1 Tax=Arundo donax TaxID=35708 RepID=A0A0A8Y399_ARUDO
MFEAFNIAVISTKMK